MEVNVDKKDKESNG